MTGPVPDPAPSTELQRSALGGFVWLSMGNGVRAVLKIAVLAVLGRLLEPSDFGLVAAAGVVVWFSMIFSSLGVGPALVQRREITPAHVETGFASSAIFGVLLAAAVALGAPWIAALFRIPELVPILRGIALVFPLAGLSVVAESLLQRELKFRSIAAAELLSYAVGYGLVGIALALLGAGAWSLVGAEISKTAIKSLYFLVSVPHSKRMRFSGPAFRDLLGFGAGYTVGGLSAYVASQGDNFVVARFLGSAALGLYGRAYELMMVPAQALGTILDKILFPTMAQLQDQPDRLRLAYRRGTALVALLVLPVSAATLVLAPEVVRALLGPRWMAAVVPLQILVLGMYFRVARMVGQSLANSAGAVQGTAWRNAVYAGLVVGGALAGQRWGLTGVATGVALAIAVNFAMVFHLAGRLTRLPLGGFVAVHLPALSLAANLGLEAWLTATAMRGVGAPALVTLLAAAVVMLPSALLLLRLFPGGMLGAEGIWLIDTLCRSAPAPVRPLLRRALAPQG